jgi:site-specific recombinase
MRPTHTDLDDLLGRLDPEATLAQRHLWLIAVVDWVRGPTADVPATLRRVEDFLDAVERRPGWLAQWRLWWHRFRQEVDMAPLLADYGFASKSVFFTELLHRLRGKLLPASPVTTDMAELFGLLFSNPLDRRWLRALPWKQLQRLAVLLGDGAGTGDQPLPTPTPTPATTPTTSRSQVFAHLNDWELTLVDALTFCVGQISAAGFMPELRVRMSAAARRARTFHELPVVLEQFRHQVVEHGPRSPGALEQAALLRKLLDDCRHAAYTVYAHLEEHGISVGIVFRLRQLRERVLRAKALVDCLQSAQRPRATAHLLSDLVQVGRDNRSIRALIATSTQLTAAKVAERSAETGEGYITRNWAEYRLMFLRAGGGGLVLGFTTWFKFLIGGLALSAFWGGFAAGLNYAIAFVFIQLLHFTVATKQPAVTAPAMVAKLKEIKTPGGALRFVDEVAHLFRSQVAAILGNLALVAPMVLIISTVLLFAGGQPMLTEDYAHHVLHAHQVLGPTLLFAAFTGLLLFASSIVAGWVENWFVLHKLDSALEYNPRITRALGVARARRWSQFMRRNVSGLAANISLGFMLGLVPAIAAFFGLGLEVRHVTLVMGQLTAAVAALGWEVFATPAFWSAVLATLLVGPINLTVSFYLAFRLALRAQGVSDVNRQRIQSAIRHRLRKAPLSFLWPVSEKTEAALRAVPDVPPPEEVEVPAEGSAEAEQAVSPLAQVEAQAHPEAGAGPASPSNPDLQR